MGYDLHITRREQWSDKGNDISSEEWLAVIAGDPELHPTTECGPFFVVWSGPSSLAHPWLDWSDGQVFTKNPDESLIDKMVEVARKLRAEVQGDDGEVYKGGMDRSQAERISSFRLLRLRLSLLFSRFFSQPKFPHPPFQVGDRVSNSVGELATVKAISRRANYGYGEIRLQFDDGRTLTYALFAHGFSKVVDTEPLDAT